MQRLKLLPLLSVFFLLAVRPTVGQTTPPLDHAAALADITAYADLPGFKETVKYANLPADVEWVASEDGFHYTGSLAHIGVFAYRVLHRAGRERVVATYLDSEGTATYSYILRVEVGIEEMKLLEIIGGGDRCHGAVVLDDIEIEGHVLSFQTLITPLHIVNWYEEIANPLQFAGCMTCCGGLANFSYDLKSGEKTFENIYLVGEYLPDEPALVQAYEEFIAETFTNLVLILDAEQLPGFIARILEIAKGS